MPRGPGPKAWTNCSVTGSRRRGRRLSALWSDAFPASYRADYRPRTRSRTSSFEAFDLDGTGGRPLDDPLLAVYVRPARADAGRGGPDPPLPDHCPQPDAASCRSCTTWAWRYWTSGHSRSGAGNGQACSCTTWACGIRPAWIPSHQRAAGRCLPRRDARGHRVGRHRRPGHQGRRRNGGRRPSCAAMPSTSSSWEPPIPTASSPTPSRPTSGQPTPSWPCSRQSLIPPWTLPPGSVKRPRRAPNVLAAIEAVPVLDADRLLRTFMNLMEVHAPHQLLPGQAAPELQADPGRHRQRPVPPAEV